MKVFTAICVQDYSVTGEIRGEPGKTDTASVERGKEYTVSDEYADGTRTVFTRYWFRVPSSVLAGVRPL